jgi:Uma2 family endonuclease
MNASETQASSPDHPRVVQENASLEAYLTLEAHSEGKHEYEAGRILAMSGGTLNHSRLGGRAFGFIRDQILQRGLGCEVFNSDARVYIARQQRIFYPDATLVCGPLETAEADPEAIVNPRLIVEVLSPTTEVRDRSHKFEAYASLEGFREYVLIDSQKPRVDVFYRQDAATWYFRMYTRQEESIRLHTLEADWPMAALYEGLME